MSEQQKNYDVVIFGATGYTGCLCAKYLAQHSGNPSWALAGRNPERLEALSKKLGLSSKVGTIVAETSDLDSLRKMVQQTKAIINVAGPFRKLGAEKVVKACVENGVGYADLSGESAFNASLNKYHEEAKRTGAIIAPSVGFDSLPFDLAVYLAAEHLSLPVEDALVGVAAVGGVSAGTILSGIDMAEQDRTQLQSSAPDWLSPIKGIHHLNFQPAIYFSAFNKYGLWSPTSPHNHRIVNRTWGLLQEFKKKGQNDGPSYSPTFQYRDGVIVPYFLVAFIVSVVIKINMTLMAYIPPIRWAVRSLLPRNWGPSESQNINGSMDLRAVVKNKDGSKASICRMKAKGDPGYHLTARMITETALTIALEPRSSLPAIGRGGGVHTSATMGGQTLAGRLVKYAGFEIQTSSYSENDSKKIK